MINNWDYHNLNMDFSSYTDGNDHPSDVDMLYICRDDTLIIGAPNAHYIRRSRGGLGIEENIVTLCSECHHDFDNGFKRESIGSWLNEYLDKFYPDFPDEKRIFNKYDWLDD